MASQQSLQVIFWTAWSFETTSDLELKLMTSSAPFLMALIALCWVKAFHASKRCISILHKTILKAEEIINYPNWYWKFLNRSDSPSLVQIHDFTSVTANLACTAATVNGANAIVVLTETGTTVRLISKYRPACPIIAISSSAAVARFCSLFHGVFALELDGEFIITNQYLWKCLDDWFKGENNKQSLNERIDIGVNYCRSLLKRESNIIVGVVGYKRLDKSDTVSGIFKYRLNFV